MTAVATTTDGPRMSAIEKLLNDPTAQARIAPFLPKGTDIPRVIASVELACQDNPKLRECTPASLVRSVAKIGQWGLEVGVTAYLVPFNKKVRREVEGVMKEEWVSEAVPIADYRGLVEMAVRTGCARSVEVGLVREGDFFEYEMGTEKRIKHVPGMKSAARITHAYAIVRLRFQSFDFVVMDRDEIETVRAASKSNNDEALKKAHKPVGLDNNAWYARKCPVRRVLNLVPKNPALAKLIAEVDNAEDGEFEVMSGVAGELGSAKAHPALPAPRPTGTSADPEWGNGRPTIPPPPMDGDYPQGMEPATGEDTGGGGPS